MAAVWIESMHNLRCPTCGARLIEQAGRFDVMAALAGDPPHPKYVADGARMPACRAGHALPDRDALYRWRDENGFPMEDGPVREVPSPR